MHKKIIYMIFLNFSFTLFIISGLTAPIIPKSVFISYHRIMETRYLSPCPRYLSPCPALVHSLMINFIINYLKCAIYLFQQNDAHKLMGKCHG